MLGLSDALPIKDVVNKVISDLSRGGDGSRATMRGLTENHPRISEEDINRLWKKAVGKVAAIRSRPTSLRKGRLVITVEDSSLLYNLTLRKREIFERLAKELKDKIQDIQFRIGETSSEGKRKKEKGKSR